MLVLEQIKEKISAAKNILILTHENPDGDAIGSALGLYNALKKMDKSSAVLMQTVNPTYSYLPGFTDIKNDIDDVSEYDLCIALDSSDLERLYVYKNYFETIEDTIVIDHHITNQNFADINYVNAVASSTCQNLIVVLATLGIAINKDIAECLYTGMLTDTGAFRYNVSPETFEFAALLLEAGIDFAKIYRLTFDTTTEKRTRILGRALSRLEILEEGKIAYTYVTNEDKSEFDCDDMDCESIVNHGRNIENVEVSIFIKEKDDKFKVSMRANEYVDVSIIATKFAGGGHLRAAGFESAMAMEQLKQAVITEVKKQLK